jgi:hypothetical protein
MIDRADEPTYHPSDDLLERLEREGWIARYYEVRNGFINRGHTDEEWRDHFFDTLKEMASAIDGLTLDEVEALLQPRESHECYRELGLTKADLARDS